MNKFSFHALCKAIPLAVALAASGGASAATIGDTYVFQWDDAETGLTGNTYKNGELIQSVKVSDENYDGDYGLWTNAKGELGMLTSDIDVRVNILEADGSLSDTWRLFGNRGDSRLGIPFHSDFENQQVQPLPGAIKLFESGDYQTVLEFSASNGDFYTWQFRSDVEAIPEPSTYALMLGGLGVMGYLARRRKV